MSMQRLRRCQACFCATQALCTPESPLTALPSLLRQKHARMMATANWHRAFAVLGKPGGQLICMLIHRRNVSSALRHSLKIQ